MSSGRTHRPETRQFRRNLVTVPGPSAESSGQSSSITTPTTTPSDITPPEQSLPEITEASVPWPSSRIPVRISAVTPETSTPSPLPLSIRHIQARQIAEETTRAPASLVRSQSLETTDRTPIGQLASNIPRLAPDEEQRAPLGSEQSSNIAPRTKSPLRSTTTAPVMVTPGRVPLRGAHGAPIFAGTPNSLLRYFRDVEDAYANAGLTPTDAQ